MILPEDDSDHMPPKGGSLSRKQQETLRMWIAQGLDFGTWVGATDGIDAISERKRMTICLRPVIWPKWISWLWSE